MIGKDGLGGVIERQRVSAPAVGSGGLRLAVEKTLRLESKKCFPLSHRHGGEDHETSSTGVC